MENNSKDRMCDVCLIVCEFRHPKTKQYGEKMGRDHADVPHRARVHFERVFTVVSGVKLEIFHIDSLIITHRDTEAFILLGSWL